MILVLEFLFLIIIC